jgi:hypothetical protein
MQARTSHHRAPNGASLPPDAQRGVGEGAPKILEKFTINPDKYKKVHAQRKYCSAIHKRTQYIHVTIKHPL